MALMLVVAGRGRGAAGQFLARPAGSAVIAADHALLVLVKGAASGGLEAGGSAGYLGAEGWLLGATNSGGRSLATCRTSCTFLEVPRAALAPRLTADPHAALALAGFLRPDDGESAWSKAVARGVCSL
eukprot:SAG22_NODE_130_length_18670_cov_12.091379_14_plen_128_part_00